MTYKSTKRLLAEFVIVGVVIVLPFFAHADFLSKFFDTAGADSIKLVSYNQDINAQFVPLLRAAINTDPNLAKGGGDIIVSDGALVPNGDIDGEDETINTKTNNGEISVYEVRDNDTLSEIAVMFDVSPRTILWANDIKNLDLIQPGDSLIILPITGVRHVVKKGDTLSSIAKKYKGDVDDIIKYNQLASADDISVGDTVVIPGGEVDTPKSVRRTSSYRGTTIVYGGGSAGFVHPLPGSVKTQGIHGYNGVDLAAPSGTPVRAVATGSVIVSRVSGWNGGYGIYVVVLKLN